MPETMEGEGWCHVGAAERPAGQCLERYNQAFSSGGGCASGVVMDIEPLTRHRLFRTDDAEEARVRMGGVLRDHRLDPGAGVMDARCDFLGVGNVGLAHLQYGVQVRVRSEPTETFRLVQIPLSGWVHVRAGSSDIASDTTVASVPEPDVPLDMKAHDSSRYLLVRFDRHALDTHLLRMLGRAPNGPLRMSQAMQLRSPAVRTWLETLRMVQADAAGPGLLRDARLRPQVGQLIMTQFLLAQPNSYSELLLGTDTSTATPRPIRRAEQLIVERARDLPSVADIAAAVGLSVRTLQEGFRRYLDTTPTERLREARLVGVHADLAAADPTTTTVAAIAADWGFWHLGRFSALYRKRWGVSPSTTLRC
ncbi:AraC family transcriptional regulator [Nocardia cyriacigeorgica]|uniref:AraC family transcriptional regulator n=2 Tax=Nocardia cyriacigeorgica TaxID=135487 RepID=A0A5R8PF86_9NOCA|nr:AraC family transcriptional regulator [Nocardia cyriacigeorgica]